MASHPNDALGITAPSVVPDRGSFRKHGTRLSRDQVSFSLSAIIVKRGGYVFLLFQVF
jgi:hypothetical protein